MIHCSIVCLAPILQLISRSANWSSYGDLFGKIVGGGQVRPVESKVEAIIHFPVPTTRRELRRFLGMVGYYRNFCINFSVVASPLTDLLSPKVPFKWTESCQMSFEQIKALLINSPILFAPDFHLRFCLLLTQVTQVRELYFSNEIRLVLNIPFAIFSRKFNNISDVTPPLRRRASLLSLLSNISMFMWVPFRIH